MQSVAAGLDGSNLSGRLSTAADYHLLVLVLDHRKERWQLRLCLMNVYGNHPTSLGRALRQVKSCQIYWSDIRLDEPTNDFDPRRRAGRKPTDPPQNKG